MMAPGDSLRRLENLSFLMEIMPGNLNLAGLEHWAPFNFLDHSLKHDIAPLSWHWPEVMCLHFPCTYRLLQLCIQSSK